MRGEPAPQAPDTADSMATVLGAATATRTQEADDPSLLRVALVTETFPPEVNGVAMTLGRLVQGLRAQGHEVRVVRPRIPDDYRNGCPLPGHACQLDTCRPGFPIPNYPDMRIGALSRTALTSRWRAQPPDVVHVATEGPMGITAIQAAHELGIPCTSSFHTNFDQYTSHYRIGILSRVIGAYMRWVHNRTACTMVPTHRQADELRRSGYHRVRVLSRGVDTALFRPDRRDEELRRSWGAGPDTVVFLTVGRVAAEKNLSLSVRAFQAARKIHPDSLLVLVGDGPERRRFTGIDGVLCVGTRCGEELASHYASCDVFLFPSLTETYGNVLIEAMASQLASVSFFYAAAKEVIVDNDRGLSVACDDEAAFIGAAVRLAKDAGLRQRLAGRAISIGSKRSWPAVLDSFVRHLREAVGQRRSTTMEVTSS